MRNIKDVSICRLLNRANAEAAISDCSAFGGPEIAVYKRTNSVLLTGIQPRKLFGKTA
jgi:hypothetical protein